MPNIVIRFLKPDQDPNKAKDSILSILCPLAINLTGLTQGQGGYILRTEGDDDTDKILSAETIKALLNVDLRVMFNPNDRAKRSLTVHGVDSKFQQTFAEKFKTKYPKDKLVSTHTEPLKGSVKLIFTSVQSVDKFLTEGITIDGHKYPPYALNRDKYIPIPECQSCYRLFPDHRTKACPDKQVKLCSKCGNQNHRWNMCTYALPPKCILCTRAGREANHPTRTLLCPERKAALQTIRRNQNQPKMIQPPRPAEAAPSPTQPPPPRPPLGQTHRRPEMHIGHPAAPTHAPRQAPVEGGGGEREGEGGKMKGNHHPRHTNTFSADKQSPTGSLAEKIQRQFQMCQALFNGKPDEIAIGKGEMPQIMGLEGCKLPPLISDTLTPLLYGMLADMTNPGTFAKAANAMQQSSGIKPTKFPKFNYLVKTTQKTKPRKKAKTSSEHSSHVSESDSSETQGGGEGGEEGGLEKNSGHSSHLSESFSSEIERDMCSGHLSHVSESGSSDTEGLEGEGEEEGAEETEGSQSPRDTITHDANSQPSNIVEWVDQSQKDTITHTDDHQSEKENVFEKQSSNTQNDTPDIAEKAHDTPEIAEKAPTVTLDKTSINDDPTEATKTGLITSNTTPEADSPEEPVQAPPTLSQEFEEENEDSFSQHITQLNHTDSHPSTSPSDSNILHAKPPQASSERAIGVAMNTASSESGEETGDADSQSEQELSSSPAETDSECDTDEDTDEEEEKQRGLAQFMNLVTTLNPLLGGVNPQQFMEGMMRDIASNQSKFFVATNIPSSLSLAQEYEQEAPNNAPNSNRKNKNKPKYPEGHFLK